MNKLLLLVLLFVALQTSAQKLVYDVYLFGDKIGSTSIERIIDKDGTEHYTLQSSSVARVLFTTRRSTQNYKAVYKNGRLIKSEAVNTTNDETTRVNVDWETDKYTISKNGKYSNLKQPIAFSTLRLYFKQPLTQTQLFSERLAEQFTVTPGTDEVEYTLSDGIKNIFRYKNGTPDLVMMKKSFITVELRLVKNEN